MTGAKDVDQRNKVAKLMRKIKKSSGAKRTLLDAKLASILNKLAEQVQLLTAWLTLPL